MKEVSGPPASEQRPDAQVGNRLAGRREDENAKHGLGHRAHRSLDQQRVHHGADHDNERQGGVENAPVTGTQPEATAEHGDERRRERPPTSRRRPKPKRASAEAKSRASITSGGLVTQSPATWTTIAREEARPDPAVHAAPLRSGEPGQIAGREQRLNENEPKADHAGKPGRDVDRSAPFKQRTCSPRPPAE